ncbi:hypothetical protein CDL15_Pgr026997 [Punica granatum]|uniref:Uncharacterized protein n=1 Tax=Punica granatum TaxID=22663 RepID=A0A218W7E5_PUNGR|nr:hypothetical protein CDL15_Pgr026997 [Punica granatum]PKI75189.1 hypothetical protein CRG98_004413 [Punica granatum]
MFGCTGYTFGQARTRGRTCLGVHGRGRSSGTRLDARAGEQELTGVRRSGDEHKRRQVDVGLVRTCMHGTSGAHGHRSARGDKRKNAHGDGRARARAQTGVRGQTCTGVIERLDGRAGDRFTVHPRAQSKLEMVKSI